MQDGPEMGFGSNPDNLSNEQILEMIKFCPVCGKSWPQGEYACSDRVCGVKVRVVPEAFNWWMFYPKQHAYLNPK